MAATRSAMIKDEERMKHMCVEFLEVDPVTYAGSDVKKAFDYAGVTRFNAHVTSLAADDIPLLLVPNADPAIPSTPMPIMTQRRLRVVLSLYHAFCLDVEGAIEVTTITKDMFDDYRVSEYNPEDPIVPWKIVLKNKQKETSKGLSEWKKSVKISRADHKEFRDETLWIRYKERFLTTLESQGLEHLIDKSFKIEDHSLDSAQSCWLYKVLQDCMVAPMAKSIVTKHLTTKDTRLIWEEICDAYDNSISAEIKAQTISGFLTGTKLVNLNWRGTQAGFISYFQEQARLYNEISKEPFSDAQFVQFLNQVLIGVVGLEQVLSMNRTARQANKLVDKTPTFQEYVNMLIQAAQVQDAGKGITSRSRRSVNKSEIYDDPDDSPSTYEADVHDLDTPVEDFVVMQMDTSYQKPKTSPRVKLNFKTWKLLEDNDRKSWDGISDKGKTAIITYAGEKAKSNFETRRQTVNNHEFYFDELVDDEDTSNVEVSMHQLKTLEDERILIDNSKIVSDIEGDSKQALQVSQADFDSLTPGLLDMAVNKTVMSDIVPQEASSNVHEHGDITIMDILSTRSEHTPFEINSHETNWPDSDDDKDDSKNSKIPLNNPKYKGVQLMSEYNRKKVPTPKFKKAQEAKKAIVKFDASKYNARSNTPVPEVKINTSGNESRRQHKPKLLVEGSIYSGIKLMEESEPTKPKPKTEFMSGPFNDVPKPASKFKERLAASNQMRLSRRPGVKLMSETVEPVIEIDVEETEDDESVIVDASTTSYPSTEAEMIEALLADSLVDDMTTFSSGTLQFMEPDEYNAFMDGTLTKEHAISIIATAKANYHQDVTNFTKDMDTLKSDEGSSHESVESYSRSRSKTRSDSQSRPQTRSKSRTDPSDSRIKETEKKNTKSRSPSNSRVSGTTKKSKEQTSTKTETVLSDDDSTKKGSTTTTPIVEVKVEPSDTTGQNALDSTEKDPTTPSPIVKVKLEPSDTTEAIELIHAQTRTKKKAKGRRHKGRRSTSEPSRQSKRVRALKTKVKAHDDNTVPLPSISVPKSTPKPKNAAAVLPIQMGTGDSSGFVTILSKKEARKQRQLDKAAKASSGPLDSPPNKKSKDNDDDSSQEPDFQQA